MDLSARQLNLDGVIVTVRDPQTIDELIDHWRTMARQKQENGSDDHVYFTAHADLLESVFNKGKSRWT